MKKILLIALVLTMGFVANAQRGGSDTFFGWDDSNYGDRGTVMDNPNDASIGFGLPGGPLGGSDDQNAPLGSGLLVLTALGAGYAVARKKR